MAQISEALAARGTLAHFLSCSKSEPNLLATQPPPFGTTSTISNPFSDTHEVSSLADVDVGNLNQVEMSTFESEAGGSQFMISLIVLVTRLIMPPEAAVVLELHGRDGTTQEVSAKFPLAVVSGDRTDEEGEMLPRVKLVCG